MLHTNSDGVGNLLQGGGHLEIASSRRSQSPSDQYLLRFLSGVDRPFAVRASARQRAPLPYPAPPRAEWRTSCPHADPSSSASALPPSSPRGSQSRARRPRRRPSATRRSFSTRSPAPTTRSSPPRWTWPSTSSPRRPIRLVCPQPHVQPDPHDLLGSAHPRAERRVAEPRDQRHRRRPPAVQRHAQLRQRRQLLARGHRDDLQRHGRRDHLQVLERGDAVLPPPLQRGDVVRDHARHAFVLRLQARPRAPRPTRSR